MQKTEGVFVVHLRVCSMFIGNGLHIRKDIWDACSEVLECTWEPGNRSDMYVVTATIDYRGCIVSSIIALK